MKNDDDDIGGNADFRGESGFLSDAMNGDRARLSVRPPNAELCVRPSNCVATAIGSLAASCRDACDAMNRETGVIQIGDNHVCNRIHMGSLDPGNCGFDLHGGRLIVNGVRRVELRDPSGGTVELDATELSDFFRDPMKHIERVEAAKTIQHWWRYFLPARRHWRENGGGGR